MRKDISNFTGIAVFCFLSWTMECEGCLPTLQTIQNTPVFLGFPCGSAGKESACNEGELGSIPGWENSLEKGKATHSSMLAWRIPWT